MAWGNGKNYLPYSNAYPNVSQYYRLTYLTFDRKVIIELKPTFHYLLNIFYFWEYGYAKSSTTSLFIIQWKYTRLNMILCDTTSNKPLQSLSQELRSFLNELSRYHLFIWLDEHFWELFNVHNMFDLFPT